MAPLNITETDAMPSSRKTSLMPGPLETFPLAKRNGRESTDHTEITDTVGEAMGVALRHHQAGDFVAAAKIYQQVIELNPLHADAWHLLGLIGHQSGQQDSAIPLIQQALQIDAGMPDAHANLGAAYAAIGKGDEAIRSYRAAVRLQPNHTNALNGLGNQLGHAGQVDQAVKYLGLAIKSAKRDPRPLSNLGALYLREGMLDEAHSSLNKALRIDSGLVEARSNLGLVQTRLGKVDDAIGQFKTVLQNAPQRSSLWRNLRNALTDRAEPSFITNAYQSVLADDDRDLLEILTSSICPVISQSTDQIDNYRHTLVDQLDRSSGLNLIDNVQRLMTHQLVAPFYLPYHGRDDRPLKQAFADMVGQPAAPPAYQQSAKHVIGSPIHLCFPLALDRDQMLVRFMGGAIEQLIECGEFRVTVACFRQNHATLQRQLPPQVQYLIINEQVEQSAKAIGSLSADVLYHCEIGTDCFNYYLPFFQAAPIQVASWGVPVTTGIAAVDYFLSSELIEPPEAEQHYSESLITLKTMPVVYKRPRVRPPQKDRQAFGFTDQQRLYGCLQSIFKLHPDYDSLLAEILRRDDQAVIALVGGMHESHADLLRERFKQSIPEVMDRIKIFPRMPREDFDSLSRACDVLLDTLHFGAGATAYEALGMGLPLVTLPGRFMRGRVTEGCYRMMQMDDCVARDEQHFVDLALQIANNPDQRHSIRQRIQERSDCLFDNAIAAEELKQLFMQLGHESRQKRVG